jgi:hypothetical protein
MNTGIGDAFDLLLARPDQHVAWRGRSDANAIVARCLGREWK